MIKHTIFVSRRTYGAFTHVVTVTHSLWPFRWTTHWNVIMSLSSEALIYNDATDGAPSRGLHRKITAAVRASQCATSSPY